MDDIQLIANHADVVEETANLLGAAPASEIARSARAVLIGELQPYIDSSRSKFSELFVMDPDTGKVVASTSPTEEGKLKVGHLYFDKGRTDLYLQTPYYSEDLAAPAMTVAVPLRAADGLVAVLAGRLNLAGINGITQRRTGLRRTEDSYLVNPERVLVTQPRFIQEPAVLRRKLDTEDVRRLVAGNNGVILTPDYRGIPSIGAFRWNAKHQLGLIVEMDKAEALAPAYAFGWSVVLISSLAMLATVGLAFLLARTITRPLRTLHERVRRFGGEHSDEPLTASAGDDVSALATEFDHMAAHISERTAEVATANEALQAENAERKRAEYLLSESQRLGHIGSWFYDMTGPILWSDEMYRLFGVSPDAFIPTPESLLSTIHPNDRPAMQAWITACATGKAPDPLEYRVIMPDGTLRFMRGHGEGVFGAGNQFIHMAGTVQDVTERKAGELTLRESESRFRSLSAASPLGIFQTDAGGRCTYTNQRWGEISGQTLEESLGLGWNQVLHPEDRERVLREWQESTSRCEEVFMEYRMLNARKETRSISTRVKPMQSGDGVITGWVGTIEDITEQKLAHEDLRRETALLAAQLESALDGILVLDNEGRQILRNDRFIDMWKVPRDAAEEMDDRKRLEFAANQTSNPTQFLEKIAHLSSHPDEITHDEIEMVGGAVLERYSGPVRAKDGKHYGRIFNFRDITASKLAQEEREKFVALIESSADFIGMATLEGRPYFLNAAGREMVGLDRDLSSTSIAEFFDDVTAALLQNTGIPASFATGRWMGEGWLRHFQTHALIPVHIHSILVRNQATGEPICIATVQRNITDIREAERKLEKANRELIDVSRLSGMTEVATSVLHNVGNLLNSVNVSADRISEKVKRLKPVSLEKVATLMRAHAHDLPEFLAHDPQGKELPGYLGALIAQLADPQKDILSELISLRKNVDHIREIVRMQQNYARGASVLETMALADLVEDAIGINAASLTRHEVRLIREFLPVPRFPIDKHKVLQILVNLLSNAKHALDAAGGRDSQLTVRIEMNGGDTVKVSVADNGVGIAPENLTRMFQHGFTTREGGHGFGLHSGALAAQELGGSLTAASGGSGQGAVFTLELPCHVTEQVA